MRIRPKVYLIKGRASNLYLCLDEVGLALIDAGSPGDQGRVLAEIERLGFRPEQLNHIFVTHADIDHAGGLAALQELSGATIYAGPQTAELLLRGRSADHLPPPLQGIINRLFIYRPPRQESLQLITDGAYFPLLAGLLALATPGHTTDHFSFYCPAEGILFAGDALNTRGKRLQRTPKFITADEPAADASAIRLLTLAPAVFACGHGPPLQDHKSDDLMEIFNQLRGRQA